MSRALLPDDEEDKCYHGDYERHQHCRREPTISDTAHNAEEESNQANTKQNRARQVEAFTSGVRGDVMQQEVGREGADDTNGQVDQENPTPGGNGQDKAA